MYIGHNGIGGGPSYYQCPDCGFKQKSNAAKRIKCHRCGRSYLRRTAKQVEKSPDEETGTGFVKYAEDND
jgi:ssDNA-binding Zn-finger/Zn-ribbon topoisomerase 1